MKHLFFAFFLVLASLSSMLHFQLPTEHTLAMTYQCSTGNNDYNDGSYTIGGVLIWGDVCMHYPTNTTWGATSETRSGVWVNTLESDIFGEDRCGGGAWRVDFEATDGPRSANYTDAYGAGDYMDCYGLGNERIRVGQHLKHFFDAPLLPGLA